MEIDASTKKIKNLYVFLGSLFFLFGISIANVIRGKFELFFYISLLLVFILNRPKLPIGHTLFLFSSILLLINPIFRDVDAQSIIYYLGPIIQGILIASGLFYIFKLRDVESINLILIYYICFQAFAALFLFFNLDLRNEFLLYLYKNDALMGEAFINAFLFRGYGFSRHFLYGFPLALSLFISFLMFSNNVKTISKFVCFFICLLLCALNARTGILLLLVTFVFYTISNRNGFKIIMFSFLTISLISLFLFFSNFDSSGLAKYLKWISEFFTIFTDVENNETVKDLKSMLQFPNDIYGILFGTGVTLSAGSSNYSDIGMIRAIFKGGGVFLVLVFILYFSAFKYISRLVFISGMNLQLEDKKNRSVLFLSFCSCFVLAMIKGEAYSISDYSRAIFTLSYLSFLILNDIHKVRC
ncbi:hypothetical protein [Shewanella xiamenensis]|uniref:hypothetical protein n=1 Tax=Shewanella xiamenensis TaxID=332186 RepID=UPI0011872CCC|nr:hypothetical protein [Shewanella xiamenensis]TVL33366.1 hypothetical protein AYI95_06535 [Shewanella xiamenensis]